MSARSFLSHPITNEWRERVKEQLERRGRGAQERLREYIVAAGVDCSSGKLADILKTDGYQTSDIVEPVHEFFGWQAPLPPTASIDAGEVNHLLARITDEQRDFAVRAIGVIAGQSGDEAERAVRALVEALSPKPKG